MHMFNIASKTKNFQLEQNEKNFRRKIIKVQNNSKNIYFFVVHSGYKRTFFGANMFGVFFCKNISIQFVDLNVFDIYIWYLQVITHNRLLPVI